MILAPTDLRDITGKQKGPAQARQLAAWGVPYRTRKDGSLVVLRDDLVSSRSAPKAEPRLRLK